MTESTQYLSLRRTKLYRPAVVSDYVSISGIESRLNAADQRIVVVSAPAGYGKSSLISHWIDKLESPNAWISLDDQDNDFRSFLSILGASLEGKCQEAWELLERVVELQELPRSGEIADALAVQIDQCDEQLVLVLDDYHYIHTNDVHEFVSSLLMHLPSGLRVVVISRRRPPLSLSRLRSQNLVLDVQLQNLQFDIESTRTLAGSAINGSVDDATADTLHSACEGWPAGLRMLLIALEGQSDVRGFLEQFKGSPWLIQEYLADEVLTQLPQNVLDCMYKTSLLDRFSADLIDTVISNAGENFPSGKNLLGVIRNRGLFCISLDEHGEWFRYHHLFKELLIQKCQDVYSRDEIMAVHSRAAGWFDRAGLLEDAVRCAQRADDIDQLITMVVRHGRSLTTRYEFNRVDRLLEMLPPETVDGSPDLLLLQGWTLNKMGRASQMIDVIDTVSLLVKESDTRSDADHVRFGQLCALRASLEYHNADGNAALMSSRKAIDILPREFTFERVEATLIEVSALQMLGEISEARQVIYSALEQSKDESVHIRARLLMSACYLHWMSADLHDLQCNADALLSLAQTESLPYALVHACWFSGIASFQMNDLKTAAEVVEIVTATKWWPHHRSYSNCVQILSWIHAARDQHSQARELADSLLTQSLESSTTFFLSDVQSLRANLAFTRGEHSVALNWALEFQPGQLVAGWGVCAPELIAARILLSSETEDAQQKAILILDKCEPFYESIHNTRYLVETLALRAIQLERSGEEDRATEHLSQAVSLAHRGDLIRVFIDIGMMIGPLLNRLEADDDELGFIGRVLAGIGSGADEIAHRNTIGNVGGMPGSLSKREVDVLELLVEHLTNKEIGERLFISAATVKRHLHNIYGKLNVSGRREAIAKATGMGLVSN